MKVMIPFSGGLDSTVLLNYALTETTHKVVAVYYGEDYNKWFTLIESRLRDQATKIATYLQDKVRPFEFRIGELKYEDVNGVQFPRREYITLAPGFAKTRPTYYLRCRAATHGHNASLVRPDVVWTAACTWNRRRKPLSAPNRTIAGVYQAYTDIPLVRWWTKIGYGRLAVRRLLPDSLRQFLIMCAVGTSVACGECRLCKLEVFYNALCADLSIDTILKVEQRVERLGMFGRYQSLADPATYDRLQFWKLFDDIDAWREWLLAGADPLR